MQSGKRVHRRASVAFRVGALASAVSAVALMPDSARAGANYTENFTIKPYQVGIADHYLFLFFKAMDTKDFTTMRHTYP